jgi:hypothetical protein
MKIILSHPPGAGGSHIASMLGNGNGFLDDKGAWRSNSDILKLAEIDVIEGKIPREEYLQISKKLFDAGEPVICTHQTDWPMAEDASLVRLYWTKPSLSKYFCYRDINTLTIERVLPLFYSDSDLLWKIMMDVSIPLDQRVSSFLANHLLKNKNLIPGKISLGTKWMHLCIDNILSMDFVDDLKLFCDYNSIEFDEVRSKIMHENWLSHNGHDRHNWETARLKLMNSSLFPRKIICNQ